MGFYGSIINNIKTEMEFDKIYPNRYSMDQALKQGDGVYFGRYVLIEYDDQNTVLREGYNPSLIKGTDFYQIGVSDSNDLYYKYLNPSNDTFETDGLSPGDLVYVNKGDTLGYYEYYECVKDASITEGTARFILLKTSSRIELDGFYNLNYSIDYKAYPNLGKGYDSTVWQKVNENGEEKYVMIAELNSVIPTFHLETDSPSIFPESPYFDANQSNQLYILHWQPQWGFRIKTAKKYNIPALDLKGNVITNHEDVFNSDFDSLLTKGTKEIPSDTKILFQRNYRNNNGQWEPQVLLNFENDKCKWVPKTSDIDDNSYLDAAIYFNKQGFNPNEITYSEGYQPSSYKNNTYINGQITEGNISDSILIEPTGRSGTIYKNRSSTTFGPNYDTQELSIMLPSIGNTIAEMWDLIYGNKELNKKLAITDSNNIITFKRNTDIYWEDAKTPLQRKGLRLIEYDDNNNIQFNPPAVNTLAGCINTVHDLMGMIICDYQNDILPPIEQADLDKIYYSALGSATDKNDSNFFYKVEDPILKEISSSLNADDYYFNINLLAWDNTKKYYHIEGDNYIKAQDNKDISNYYTFYQPNIQIIDEFVENNNLYYKDNEYNFRLANTNENIPDYVFYFYKFNEIESCKITFNNNRKYKKGYYYYKDTKTNDFILDNENNKTDDRIYYCFDIEPIKFSDTYEPYVYYYKPNPNIEEYLIDKGNLKKIPTLYKATDLVGPVLQRFFIPGYYCVKDDTNPRLFKPVDTYNPEQTYYEPAGTEIDDEGNEKIIYNIVLDLKEFNPDDNLYITLTNEQGYKKLTKDLISLSSIPVYTITFTAINNNFYDEQNKNYYYKENSNFYPINHHTDGYDSNKEYYLINHSPELLTDKFYTSNTYYYKQDNEYLIDTNEQKTPQRQYFIKKDIYVKQDDYNILKPGSIWNGTFNDIPDSIHLAIPESHYKYTKMLNFGKDTNTINGLILKIHRLLAFDTPESRDNKTVQGCINIINDYIYNFEDMNPHDFVLVDAYHRMHGAKCEHDKWINVNIEDGLVPINGDINKNLFKFTLSHKKAEVIDKTTSINLNTKEEFIIHDLSWDEKGHINIKNTQTLTLPNYFKTIKIKTKTDNEQSIEPTVIRDTLNINADNTWLELITENKTITIKHLPSTSGIADTYGYDKNQKLQFGSNIQSYSYTIDIAGHITKAEPFNITLPSCSLDNTEKGNIITDLSLEEKSGKITVNKKNVGNLLLTDLNTNLKNKENIAATDSINIALSKLQANINMINGTEEGSIQKAINDLKGNCSIGFGTLAEIETKIKSKIIEINWN